MYCNPLSSHWEGWNEYPLLNSRPMMRKHGLSSISVFVILYSQSLNGRPRNCESTNATAASLQGGAGSISALTNESGMNCHRQQGTDCPMALWQTLARKYFTRFQRTYVMLCSHLFTNTKNGQEVWSWSCQLLDFGQDMPRLRNVLSDTILCERNHPLDHHQVCRS